MKKTVCIIVAMVCLCACGVWLWADSTGAVSQPAKTTLRLSHNMLTVDVDNILAHLLVTYTGSAQLSWTSSDPAIVEVDEHGFIRGVAPGRAYITCTDGQKNSQCCVTVVEKLEPFTLSGPRDIELRPLERKQVGYTYTGKGALAYTTNDPRVVTFENGVLVAKAPGTAIITCTDGLITTQARVTVRGWFGK